MGKTVATTNPLSLYVWSLCYFWDLNVQGIQGTKLLKRFNWNLSSGKSSNMQRCVSGDLRNFRHAVQVRWILRYSYVPADWGTWQLSLTRKVTCHSSPLCSNTNTDSGVLVPDIFNYLVSTFISSHLLPYSWIDDFLFSYFRHSCTSEEKEEGRSQQFAATFM